MTRIAYSLVLAAVTAGSLMITSNNDAQAQSYAQAKSYKIDKNTLEQVEWHKSPRQIQIVNSGPIITDHRTVQPQPEQVLIHLKPLKAGSQQSGALSQGLLSTLPKSGFGGSNIPVSGLAPQKSLPQGNSTNMLAGTFKPTASEQKTQKTHSVLPLASKPATTQIATYSNVPFSSSQGSSKMQTVTTVSAKLQRGALLGAR